MHQFTLQTPKLFVDRSQGRSRFLLLLHCISVLCWCENKMIIEPDVYSDLQMEIKCNKEYRTEHTKVLCKEKKNLVLSCQIIYMLWTWSGRVINEEFLIMAVFDVIKIPDVTSQCLHIWNVHRTSGSVGTWVIMPSKQMIAADGPAGALYHLSSRSVIMVLIPHADSLLRNCRIWGPIPRSQPPNKEVEWMRFISELEMLRPFREYRLQAVSCSHWSQRQEWVIGNGVTVGWEWPVHSEWTRSPPTMSDDHREVILRGIKQRESEGDRSPPCDAQV